MSKSINIYVVSYDEGDEAVIVEYEDFEVVNIVTVAECPEDNSVTRLGLGEAFKEVAELGGADFIRLHYMTEEEYASRYDD